MSDWPLNDLYTEEIKISGKYNDVLTILVQCMFLKETWWPFEWEWVILVKYVILNKKDSFSEQEHRLYQASVTARLHCLFVNLHLLGKGVYGQGCQAQGVLQMAMIAYSVSGFCSCAIHQLFICMDLGWIQSSLYFFHLFCSFLYSSIWRYLKSTTNGSNHNGI